MALDQIIYAGTVRGAITAANIVAYHRRTNLMPWPGYKPRQVCAISHLPIPTVAAIAEFAVANGLGYDEALRKKSTEG